MTARLTLAVAAAVGGLASACAAPVPPSALLTYERQDCAASPVLTDALSLTPDKARVSYAVSAQLDVASACITTASGPSPYALYALPADIDGKTLTVGGVLEMARIFSPDVAILDAEGRIVRTFSAVDYLYRGPIYSVQFRPRAGEAYVLVTADSGRVGQQYNSIVIGTSTTSTYAGGGVVTWSSGLDNAQARTFSYEGVVQATIYDTEIDEGT